MTDGLAAARAQNGSDIINVIHYRFAAMLPRRSAKVPSQSAQPTALPKGEPDEDLYEREFQHRRDRRSRCGSVQNGSDVINVIHYRFVAMLPRLSAKLQKTKAPDL